MDRTVKTLNDAWREWHIGFTGKPSVKYMEDKYGTLWRNSAAETKYYNRRHIIIKFIEDKAKIWNLPIPDVIKRIERAETAAGIKSLNNLREKIEDKTFQCL